MKACHEPPLLKTKRRRRGEYQVPLGLFRAIHVERPEQARSMSVCFSMWSMSTLMHCRRLSYSTKFGHEARQHQARQTAVNERGNGQASTRNDWQISGRAGGGRRHLAVYDDARAWFDFWRRNRLFTFWFLFCITSLSRWVICTHSQVATTPMASGASNDRRLFSLNFRWHWVSLPF